MTATSLDLSQIKTDALSAASTFRTLIGLGTLATQSPTGTPSASNFLRGDYSWQTIDLSGYVPYTGANANLNLGSYTLTAKSATLSTGTITTSTPAVDISQTWNSSGIAFTAAKINVTNTASVNSSLLLDLQIASVSKFNVTLAGNVNFTGALSAGATANFLIPCDHVIASRTTGSGANSDSILDVASNTGHTGRLQSWTRAGTIVASIGTTGSASFKTSAYVYNTSDAALNNYERGVLDWQTTSNVFRIGTEAAGTGTVRNIALVGGNVGIGTTTPAQKLVIQDSANGEVAFTVTNQNTSGTSGASVFNFVSGSTITQFVATNESYNNASGYGGFASTLQLINRNGAILFKTGGYGDSSERMRITSAGNVGIGTTSPTFKAQVNAARSGGGYDYPFAVTMSDQAATDTLILPIGKSLTNGNMGYIGFTYSGSDSDQNRLTFGFVNSDNAMVITNNIGNVGISTTSPAAKLDILDTTSAGSGSLAASTLNIATTWNTTGTPTLIKANVTDTASNAASLLMDLQVGGSSKFKISKGGAVTLAGSLTISALNIVTDTTTGTKIGTATTQKLGFYNATPVVQPTAVADATDAASVITQLNALLSRMRDLGLIAT